MVDKYINDIIQGDCIEVLKQIPGNSIDMTFADPPFNLKKNVMAIGITRNLQNTWDGARIGY
ncbi:MAG: hypothetical protein ABIF11_09475 [Nitrospirota bacterium]